MRIIDADRLMELYKNTPELNLDNLNVPIPVIRQNILDTPTVNAVVLPCNIGDTVYRVCKKKYDVDGYGMQWEEDWGIVTDSFHLGMFHEIGKNVFLTRKEAEKIFRSK